MLKKNRKHPDALYPISLKLCLKISTLSISSLKSFHRSLIWDNVIRVVFTNPIFFSLRANAFQSILSWYACNAQRTSTRLFSSLSACM